MHWILTDQALFWTRKLDFLQGLQCIGKACMGPMTFGWSPVERENSTIEQRLERDYESGCFKWVLLSHTEVWGSISMWFYVAQFLGQMNRYTYGLGGDRVYEYDEVGSEHKDARINGGNRPSCSLLIFFLNATFLHSSRHLITLLSRNLLVAVMNELSDWTSTAVWGRKFPDSPPK